MGFLAQHQISPSKALSHWNICSRYTTSPEVFINSQKNTTSWGQVLNTRAYERHFRFKPEHYVAKVGLKLEIPQLLRLHLCLIMPQFITILKVRNMQKTNAHWNQLFQEVEAPLTPTLGVLFQSWPSVSSHVTTRCLKINESHH